MRPWIPEEYFPFFGYILKDRNKMSIILSIHLFLLGTGEGWIVSVDDLEHIIGGHIWLGFICILGGIWSIVTQPFARVRRALMWFGEAYLFYSFGDLAFFGFIACWKMKRDLTNKSQGLAFHCCHFYVYGYNNLRSQCAYDVAPSGLLASMYHLTRIEDGVAQPEELCIKVFASKRNHRIPSVF
uniref:Uncharacterized protein n=1 Tax=Solanum lycopersicum TaxID=4081 RepID=K4AVL5_SOLLC